MTPDTRFLRSTDIIDFTHPAVASKARALAARAAEPLAYAKACFEFVRDEIQHSGDYRRGPVTCTAPEVLREGTGFCYAKSHLLAALLRHRGIPAGLCYQRVSIGEGGAPFCLHGLNAIHLEGIGWYRVDARGNKPGVNAQFDPPHECLAFRLSSVGECDLPEIWPDPLPVVVEALRSHAGYQELNQHLPDLELW